MMKFRVIDLETTGLPEKDGADICEVGYTDVTLDGEVGETHSHLINPGHPIPPEMSAIHHIIDDDVASMPLSDFVLPYLTNDTSMTDVFVAHNAAFEKHFMPLPNRPWICTHKVAYWHFPDLEKHNNQFLRYYLNLPVDREFSNQAHRAGPDSHVTAHLLAWFLRSGVDAFKMKDVSSKPIILRTCPLNKFYGRPWEEVDDGYLEWILRTPDMKQEVHDTARHHLDLRRQNRANPFGE